MAGQGRAVHFISARWTGRILLVFFSLSSHQNFTRCCPAGTQGHPSSPLGGQDLPGRQIEPGRPGKAGGQGPGKSKTPPLRGKPATAHLRPPTLATALSHLVGKRWQQKSELPDRAVRVARLLPRTLSCA